jgi:hypothetical protein
LTTCGVLTTFHPLMETTTTKERKSLQETQQNATEAVPTEMQSASSFFADIQLYDQLAHQKKEIETQMENLRLKIIPSFNERFASLGIALPQSVIAPLTNQQNRSQAQLPEETEEVTSRGGNRGKGNKGGGKGRGRGRASGGVTKLQTAQDIINKLGKQFTVKEFKGELEKQGNGDWQIGYLIQELRHRNFIKNVGYGEYERV